MSQFLPEPVQSTPSGVTQFTPKSPETSQADVALAQRVFAAMAQNPLMIPPDFMAYLVDYIQTSRLIIPIGQVFGFSQFTAQPADQIITDETTASTTYVDLTTTGPELQGLPGGKYLILFSAQAWNDTSGDGAVMSVSLNGGAAGDGDSASTSANAPESILSFVTTTLSDASNSIVVKYRADVGGTANFQRRKLLALKYANL